MKEPALVPILREGVDVVKLIFFRRLKEHLSGQYPHRDSDYIRKLAASVINEVFGESNAQGPLASFSEQNKGIIQEQMDSLSIHMRDMQIPLTDALRIQFLCDHQEGRDSREVLEKARTLGLLLPEREVPLPAKFIHMVRKVGSSLKILDGS